MIPDNEIISRVDQTAASEASDQEERNYFSKYLADEANPFDKPVEEEENEDVFSGVGVRSVSFQNISL